MNNLRNNSQSAIFYLQNDLTRGSINVKLNLNLCITRH